MNLMDLLNKLRLGQGTFCELNGPIMHHWEDRHIFCSLFLVHDYILFMEVYCNTIER